MRCRDLYQQGREYAVVVDAKEADTARGELEHYEAVAYPAEPVSAEDRVGFSPEIEGGKAQYERCTQADI